MAFTPDARSTTPLMTSMTEPSGTVIESGHNADNAGWYVFNKSTTYNSEEHWDVLLSTVPWVGFDYGTGYIIDKYGIVPYPDPDIAPKDFHFDGWDGSAWVTLDTQTGITDWEVANDVTTEKFFTFTNTTAYTKYRLQITATKYHGDWVILTEVEFCGEAYSPPARIIVHVDTCRRKKTAVEVHVDTCRRRCGPVVAHFDTCRRRKTAVTVPVDTLRRKVTESAILAEIQRRIALSETNNTPVRRVISSDFLNYFK